MINNKENLPKQEQNLEQPSSIRRPEKLTQQPEKNPELSSNNIDVAAEKARLEALETAVSAKSEKKEMIKQSPEKIRRGVVGKKELNKSFEKTMQDIQSELTPLERTFSKIMHNKIIEKTSDILGSTIARPSSILAGAFVAFIFTLLTYTVAKTIGYTLSGSETIIAFIAGWIVGTVYDLLKIVFVGRN